MNTSTMFNLNESDVIKGLVMAVITGVLLPVSAIIQTPGFSISTANWHVILTLAGNGAIVGFISYLTKNFVSNGQGQVLGKIG